MEQNRKVKVAKLKHKQKTESEKKIENSFTKTTKRVLLKSKLKVQRSIQEIPFKNC